MNRRSFLTLGAAGAAGLLHRPFAAAQGFPVGDVPYGQTRLNISDDFRDGTLYIPKSYKPGLAMPLLIMLHGYSGSAESVRFAYPLAEELGIIVIAPESRDVTWGRSVPGFDADVRYLGAAFRRVSSQLTIDNSRVALGGVSDGAGYALNMGLAYGDTFNHLMIFAAGMLGPLRQQGHPRIFIAHGINDAQMDIDRTARIFVPKLKEDGYDVTYREYDGGHGPTPPVIREGFEWFVHM
jgi:phospholipase/carboxylesterase